MLLLLHFTLHVGCGQSYVAVCAKVHSRADLECRHTSVVMMNFVLSASHTGDEDVGYRPTIVMGIG